jgi:hypothetical protein
MPELKTSPQLIAASEAPYQSIVIGAGVVTTVAALAAVYYLNRSADVNVMGWYLDYLLPAGAILVGLAAGSGYGIASWFTGTKIRRRLLASIVILQLLAYAGAEYLEFASLGPVHLPGETHILTFPEYFDYEARTFAWKKEDGKTGEPLGEWGYLFRGLEVAGFTLGALIVPAVLFRKPYCEKCQVYMRTRSLGKIAASVPIRRVKKSDISGQQQYAQEQDNAYKAASEQIQKLCTCGAGGDIDGYRAALVPLAEKKKGLLKLPKRLGVNLVRCPRCDSAYLQTQLITGRGKKMKITDLERTELPQGFSTQAT